MDWKTKQTSELVQELKQAPEVRNYLRENEEAEQFLPESGYMDLQDLVREYLVMEIPYAPVCQPGCKGLCPVCGKNLNLGPCHHEDEE